jgi:hypothetical protein
MSNTGKGRARADFSGDASSTEKPPSFCAVAIRQGPCARPEESFAQQGRPVQPGVVEGDFAQIAK